jgi:hypothetical protein
MDDRDPALDLSVAAERVTRQRAFVVVLAKAKRFEELPAAHQVLRQMEDALKLARAAHGPERHPPMD